MKKEQSNLIIGIIIGIVIVFLTLYLYSTYDSPEEQPRETIPSQSSASETTQSLIYYNPTDGIKIKYPSDWTKEEETIGMTAIFLSPFESDSDNFRENLNVIVQDLSTQPMTLEEYTKLSIEQIGQIITDASIPYSIATTLDGNSANKIVYTGRQGLYSLKWMQVYTIKDNTVYILTYSAETDRYDDFLDTAQEMINSFEIT